MIFSKPVPLWKNSRRQNTSLKAVASYIKLTSIEEANQIFEFMSILGNIIRNQNIIKIQRNFYSLQTLWLGYVVNPSKTQANYFFSEKDSVIAEI